MILRYWLAIVVALSLFNLAADALARGSRFWAALAVNIACSLAWAMLLGRQGASLSRMVSVYGVLTYVFSVVAGVWFFEERLSWSNYIGVALGLVSVVLLGL